MKIGIFTLYYKNHNYGGQLQAYALCEYLNSLKGISCEQISYKNHKINKNKKVIKKILFKLYERIFYRNVMRGLAQRRECFLEFEQAVAHSCVYVSHTLGQLDSMYDLIVTGSDQVWNMEYSDENFFLKFAGAGKRCSYAASFGKNNLSNVITPEMIETLRQYRFLTVREQNAKDYLNAIGLNNCDIVCDPTLLIDADIWKSKIREVPELKSKHYLLVYLLGASQKKREQIKKFAEKNDYEIVYLPHIHFSYQKRDKNFADIEIYKAGPWEFLWLINNAAMIITDSYHCCVFSLLFNKNFYTVDRGEQSGQSTNSRIVTLLSIVNLENRMIENLNEINPVRDMNYAEVNRILKNYASVSQQKLWGLVHEIDFIDEAATLEKTYENRAN